MNQETQAPRLVDHETETVARLLEMRRRERERRKLLAHARALAIALFLAFAVFVVGWSFR